MFGESILDQSVSQTLVDSNTISNTTTQSIVQSEDISEATVILVSGEETITLTYEAYQRYIQLRDAGVG